jgi:ketosteroid isomerase-like protein
MSSSGIKKTEDTQVRELIENWARAVRAHDIDGILKHHAAEMVLFDVPPPVQSKGIDAYQKSWDLFFRWFGDAGVFDLSELTITAGDQVAFGHALIRCAGSDAKELAYV